MDDDFFAHMEEIDLCWRARNLGYKIMYCGESAVYHVGAGTLAKANPRKTYFNFRNNLFLLCKNQPPGLPFMKLGLRFFVDAVAALKFLLGGETGHCLAVMRAYLHFYGSFFKMLRKRRELKKNIRHYATGCIFRGHIVWEYFVRGKRKFSELKPESFQPGG
jgi:GT2 family glycosyltransferase